MRRNQTPLEEALQQIDAEVAAAKRGATSKVAPRRQNRRKGET